MGGNWSIIYTLLGYSTIHKPFTVIRFWAGDIHTIVNYRLLGREFVLAKPPLLHVLPRQEDYQTLNKREASPANDTIYEETLGRYRCRGYNREVWVTRSNIRRTLMGVRALGPVNFRSDYKCLGTTEWVKLARHLFRRF